MSAGPSFNGSGARSFGLLPGAVAGRIANLIGLFRRSAGIGPAVSRVVRHVPAATFEVKGTIADKFGQAPAALGTDREGRFGKLLPLLANLPACGALILIDRH